MYIINVIPLIKIPYPNPQILSYFFSEKLFKGAIIRISLRKKQINALVVSCQNLEKKKIEIKKAAHFKLKPIEKVISREPALTENQLKLLFWIAEYYFAPFGLMVKIFLSKRYKIQDTKYQIQNLFLTPQTKSLVFAPFKNLKSIIIEDADNQKYQSWGRKPYYDARKIALQLAKIFKAEITLKSSLPSVETYYWAKKKKYKLQVTSYKLQVSSKIIDLREEIKNGNYSVISRELQADLTKSNKSILYISRRGTATFILCRDCGHVVKCAHCDVPMVLHQPSNKLLCHHCGYEEKPPTLCPSCKGYRIKCFGAGTQKVETEIKKLLPKARIFRLDSDTAKSSIHRQEIIKNFNREKNAILIGTQMLLNKNLKADLVGVISIETILNLPDFKGLERIFQIITKLKKMTKTQAIRRSEAKFLVQTYNPENLAIKSAIDNNWEKFYKEEIKIRKALGYPPFSQIIKLNFEHKDPEKARNEAKILFEKLNQQTQFKMAKPPQAYQDLKFKIQLLGPVPAFIPKIKGRYRWNIIIKSKIKSQKSKIKLLMIVPPTWNIEVDPESLL